MNNLKFNQIKQQNFYVANTKNGGEVLKSYNTIVGYIANDETLYRVRYTTTTGKQITKYYPTQKQQYVDAGQLKEIIKTFEGLDLNTCYNGASFC